MIKCAWLTMYTPRKRLIMGHIVGQKCACKLKRYFCALNRELLCFDIQICITKGELLCLTCAIVLKGSDLIYVSGIFIMNMLLAYLYTRYPAYRCARLAWRLRLKAECAREQRYLAYITRLSELRLLFD